MIIIVISPFLSTHWNDRKWLWITKIITWQKIFVFVQIHCQHFYAELHVCTGLIWYARTNLWSMSILSSLASSPSSLRTSKPLNSASPSGPRPCPTWYIWRTSKFGFGGFGTQKHRGRYEDLLTMYSYITLSLSKVEIMKWEHCWTGKELSAFWRKSYQ